MSIPAPRRERTPAHRFIEKYGVPRLTRWTGRNRSRIHAWTWPKGRGGTGGRIPASAREPIIRGAVEELGEVLTYAAFEPSDGEAYLDEARP